jgi:hypothetical protein
MAEEFGLEQGLADRTHIDGKEDLLRARGHRVQAPGDEFLAGAVLAEDQHVGVGGGGPLDERKDVLHRRRFRDDVLGNRAGRLAQCRIGPLERCGLAAALPQFHARGNGRDDLLVLPGLGHEIGSAAFHRLDRSVDAAVRGDHDDDRLGVDLQDAFEPFQALLPRGLARAEVHVQQYDVEPVPLHQVGDAIGPPAGDHLGETAPQQQARCREDVVVVVDDQDGADRAHPRAPETVRNRTRSVRGRTGAPAPGHRLGIPFYLYQGLIKLARLLLSTGQRA